MTDNVDQLLRSFRLLNQNLMQEGEKKDAIDSVANLETCVRSAGKFLFSASTFVNSADNRGSQFGSEFGDELSTQHRRQIESWIPDLTLAEKRKDEGDIGSPPTLSASSSTLPPTPTDIARPKPTRKPVAPMLKEVSSMPYQAELPNIDHYLIESLVELAKTKESEKDYSGSRKVLDRILKEARVTYRTHWKWRDEVLRLCAVVYCRLGQWEDADLVLNQEFGGRREVLEAMASEFCVQDRLDAGKRLLTREFEGRDKIVELYAKRAYWRRQWKEAEEALSTILQSRLDEQDLGRYCLMQSLAEVNWASGANDTALQWCMKAMQGREMALGKYDVLYYQSVSLLTLICKSRKDLLEAERYDALLPIGFKGITLLFNRK
jgi:hypothetical protein